MLLELDRLAVKGRSGWISVYTAVGCTTEKAAWSTLLEEHAAFLAAYRAGKWDLADAALKRCGCFERVFNGYYAAMAGRITAFRASPPPKGWNGVYEAAEK